ncbi:MAG: TIGR02757 family protein [Planctomycetes bacterium]|nr:TIGR02757 family protein [Planctomycetota bacterium]
MSVTIDVEALEALYQRYNRREFVHPDPLEFLYDYEDPGDREVAGLVASSLAYGRVRQILRSVGKVLERMPAPARFVTDTGPDELRCTFADFRHRFTTGEEMAALLAGAGRLIRACGSLEKCFVEGYRDSDDSTAPALTAFAGRLREAAGLEGHLLPSPSAGSACKRLHLFLRWMVRRDAVDLGCWSGVPASKLVIPLDTHMMTICRGLGLTSRRQASLKTAMETTRAFRQFAPDDPVKYDFALTRLGIRREADLEGFLQTWAVGGRRGG